MQQKRATKFQTLAKTIAMKIPPSVMKGYLLASSGAALFSTKAIFIKLAYTEQVNASLMLAMRMLVALPFFLVSGIFILIQRRQHHQPLPEKSLLIKALLTGLIGYYVSSLLDFKGLTYISAQLERLVLFTYPIFVMILGWLIFKTRISPSGIIGALITYLGLAIVFLSDLPSGGRATVIGTILVLGCAITFALYQIFAKELIMKMGSGLFTAIAMSGSAIASIVSYCAASGGVDFTVSQHFFWLAAGTAIFATVIPAYLLNAAMSLISAQSTSMISTLSPIITIALAVFILGEPFTIVDALGTSLVITGIGYYVLSQQRSRT